MVMLFCSAHLPPAFGVGSKAQKHHHDVNHILMSRNSILFQAVLTGSRMKPGPSMGTGAAQPQCLRMAGVA
jgi:hypothetical protein